MAASSGPASSPYPNLPLAGQVPTPFIWDNTGNPIRPSTVHLPQGSPVYRVSSVVPGALDFPAAGTFWLIDYVRITHMNGANAPGTTRFSSVYLRPQFPGSPGHGDGPQLAVAQTTLPGSYITAVGEPGQIPSGVEWLTHWVAPIPATPSCELSILTSGEEGDEITFHIEGRIYTMEQGQQEVVLKSNVPLASAGHPFVHELGHSPPGVAYVPIAAESDPSTGPTVGNRRLALFYGGLGSITGPGAVVLADTSEISDVNVSNNNVTGAWVNNGTGPRDGRHHILWRDGEAAENRYIWLYDGCLIGDELNWTLVFLATPAIQ